MVLPTEEILCAKNSHCPQAARATAKNLYSFQIVTNKYKQVKDEANQTVYENEIKSGQERGIEIWE